MRALPFHGYNTPQGGRATHRPSGAQLGSTPRPTGRVSRPRPRARSFPSGSEGRTDRGQTTGQPHHQHGTFQREEGPTRHMGIPYFDLGEFDVPYLTAQGERPTAGLLTMEPTRSTGAIPKRGGARGQEEFLATSDQHTRGREASRLKDFRTLEGADMRATDRTTERSGDAKPYPPPLICSMSHLRRSSALCLLSLSPLK